MNDFVSTFFGFCELFVCTGSIEHAWPGGITSNNITKKVKDIVIYFNNNSFVLESKFFICCKLHVLQIVESRRKTAKFI